MLRKGGVGVVGGGIVQTQQHQKNVTGKDSAGQSHYLQNKTQ